MFFLWNFHRDNLLIELLIIGLISFLTPNPQPIGCTGCPRKKTRSWKLSWINIWPMATSNPHAVLMGLVLYLLERRMEAYAFVLITEPWIRFLKRTSTPSQESTNYWMAFKVPRFLLKWTFNKVFIRFVFFPSMWTVQPFRRNLDLINSRWCLLACAMHRRRSKELWIWF